MWRFIREMQVTPKILFKNQVEFEDFLDWFSNLDIPTKIFSSGNHDTAVSRGLITRKDFEDLGIIFLYRETVIVHGLKVWGIPYSPVVEGVYESDWAFMKEPEVIQKKVWDFMPENIDILITHTPPKGILDLATDHKVKHFLLRGDATLRDKVAQTQPILHCFGHVHNYLSVLNTGTKTIFPLKTVFSNGACITNGIPYEHGITHGNVLVLNLKTKNIFVDPTWQVKE